MPTAPERLPPQDLDACVALMRGGSKSFFAASRLLPVRMRSASVALYAFCRVADDVVDDSDSPQLGLDMLHQRLDAIYAGQPMDHIEDLAISLVVKEFQLPRELLDALLDGFAWDAQGRAYETLQSVHDYGARVAGSVGAMMAWIMGVRKASTLARACELGVAMQLTNIARDVGQDARNGRLYLPREWLREAGISPEAWLAKPEFNPAIRAITQRLLVEADRLYKLSSLGIAHLPHDCRAAIWAARFIYADIGQHLRAQGLDSVNHRAVVSTPRKLALMAKAKLFTWVPQFSYRKPPPLPAIAYLVNACSPPVPDGTGQAVFNNRTEWMFDLLERLERERNMGSTV